MSLRVHFDFVSIPLSIALRVHFAVTSFLFYAPQGGKAAYFKMCFSPFPYFSHLSVKKHSGKHAALLHDGEIRVLRTTEWESCEKHEAQYGRAACFTMFFLRLPYFPHLLFQINIVKHAALPRGGAKHFVFYAPEGGKAA